VEGSEAFVRAIYDDFKDRIPSDAGQRSPSGEGAGGGHDRSEVKDVLGEQPLGSAAKKTKVKSKGSKESYSVVKDLNLTSPTHGRLRDFFAKYEVKTAPDHNLIFVYFMQHKLGITGITPAHLYTCYRAVEAKVPGALRQSAFNTAKRKGWLDTSDMDDIRVTTPGENYMLHDFPKKAAK